MYFKIEKSSQLGQQIQQLWDRIISGRKAASAIASELSDMDDPGRMVSSGYIDGILHAIEFKLHPGSKWAEERRHPHIGRRFFYPHATQRKKQTELWQKFTSANDPVSEDDFCQMFGLQSMFIDSGFKVHRRPSFRECDTVYILNIHDKWANEYIRTRPADMIEILASEYHRHLEEKAPLDAATKPQ